MSFPLVRLLPATLRVSAGTLTRTASLLVPALAFVFAPSASAQISGLRGLKDHSQCCAIGMPSIHANADGTFDPAPDPLLSRRRAPAPPAPSSEATPPVASAEAPAPAELPPLKLPTAKIENHLDVGFDFLGGYEFKLTKEQAAASAADKAALAAVHAQIPELVRQLDGQKVLLTGFMLPMKMEGAVTTEFLLVANSMLCCYGVVPPMNQWVTVKLPPGKGVKPQQDVPLQFFGTLRIQPRIENDALAAIYHLDATHPRR